MPMPGLAPSARGLAIAVLVVVGLVPVVWHASPVHAQAQPGLGGVTLEIDPLALGHGAAVRAGDATPLRITLISNSPTPRDIIARWVHDDPDGDTVHAQRGPITLHPQRRQGLTLYAVPPATAPAARAAGRTAWSVQILDADSGALLASDAIAPRSWIDPRQALVGVFGSAGLGLEPYAHRFTQHEAVGVVRGLTLEELPDRWYGLSSYEALIWTRDGGRPDADRLTLDQRDALRQWVRRGGHLVIVVPAVGQTWTGSELADLFPVPAGQINRVEAVPPPWAGVPQTDAPTPVEYITFEVEGPRRVPGVDVLLRDRENRPTVVARRVGFGRVTLVGLDLASSELRAMGLPNGRHRLWNDIFHWTAPVFEPAVAEAQIRAQEMNRPDQRDGVELGRFVPSLIAMRHTAGPVLAGAVLVFGLYWLLAGPIIHAGLKRRKLTHHSWLVFVGVVVVFTGLTWGGAMLVRSNQPAVAHFSVLDVDANTGQARTQSWLSLYVPEFGRARVALGDDAAAGARQDLIASPGFAVAGESAGFLDPQPYVFNAATPHALDVPVRATAKQFHLKRLGPLDDLGPLAATPRARDLRIESAWPAGRLSHGLPSALRDVLILYAPGQGQSPWLWRHGRWEPGEVLELVPPTEATRLVRRPREYTDERMWNTEGFLGTLIGQRTGQRFTDLDPLQIAMADNEILQAVEMLSFYSALPPPNFRQTGFRGRRATAYQRAVGRSLDITHLTTGRRLIILGYLTDAPLPAELTVDGREPEASGWTVVRWVYDFE